MSILSRVTYYATSIVTMLSGFDRPARTLGIFLGWPGLLPGEIRLRRSGWRFQIRSAMDAWVIKETCLDQDYLWGIEKLEPHWAVVDVGAGLGDFTLFAAKQCRQGEVHAYEPLAASFALLTHNMELNGVTNAHLFQSGAAAQQGEIALQNAGAAAVSTRFARGKGGDTVTAAGLSQILDQLPGGRCHLMKIDCEGCEFELLLQSSAKELGRIDRICLEVHEHVAGGNGAALAAHLEANGFRVQQRPNPVHDYLQFMVAVRV